MYYLSLTFLFGTATFVSDEDELLGETLRLVEIAPTEGAMAKFYQDMMYACKRRLIV